VVLHPTRHKIGHFGVVSPSQSLGLVWKKTKPNTKKHAFTNQKKCTTTQNKLKPGLIAFYDIRPGNGAGLSSKEKIREEIKNLEKSEEKRINGQAYDRNKQTIYIAPKSKIESRADYAPEPAWGLELKNRWQCLTKVSMLLVSNSLPKKQSTTKTIDLKS